MNEIQNFIKSLQSNTSLVWMVRSYEDVNSLREIEGMSSYPEIFTRDYKKALVYILRKLHESSEKTTYYSMDQINIDNETGLGDGVMTNGKIFTWESVDDLKKLINAEANESNPI